MFFLALTTTGKIIIPIIIAVFGIAFVHSLAGNPGRILNKNFVSLGDLKGKTLAEIEKVCGQASGIRNAGPFTIRTWSRPGYMITLTFDANDRVTAKNSENLMQR